MTSSPVLHLDHAAFAYGGTVGVRDVTLDVAPGEAVALIGPNGAGKSTVLKGVLGLIPLVGGRMRLEASVASLPQTADLDPEFPITLRQVVMQGRYRSMGFLRMPGRHDRAAVADALDAVGLADRSKARFGDLSGGQRQRGLLARALASEPGLLLLDEPFNGLDQPNRDALLQTLHDLKSRGIAVLVSTHDLDLARETCDTALFLNRTQLACGPVDATLTLKTVQRCFGDVGVEVDEHTLVVPDHEGRE
ncbi:metal ABC transporter ATP-binding protein [Agromyces sp. SYSU T00194]|uniref:metal ABC transporter ATP-binding protein n=1 Tax=Agromyces chitinivorans TaxID=3158560 RepID=UPI0033943977